MKGALFVLLGLLACGPASAAECDVMSPVVIGKKWRIKRKSYEGMHGKIYECVATPSHPQDLGV